MNLQPPAQRRAEHAGRHHVFLSPYSIFVLETKNMSGWIFGSERQAQCTQKLYKRTFKFRNPLRQNYKTSKPWKPSVARRPPPSVSMCKTSRAGVILQPSDNV